MDNQRLKMYIIGCHVDKPLEEPDLESIYNVRIQAGAALTDKRIYELNDHDDFADSISDRNQRYSEMTAMYWIGKHIESEYVGIAHYRRRFLLTDAQLSDYMDEGVDIITTKSYPLPEIVTQNYQVSYYAADWKLFEDILQEFHPEDVELSKLVYAKDHIHPCNMNIFKSSVYEQYCQWIFPMLDAFYKRSPWKCDTYQRRDVGFIGERLSSLFVEKVIKDGGKVVEAPFRDLKSASWTPAMECDLTDYDAVYRACQKYYSQNNITRCRDLVSKSLNEGGIENDRIRRLAELFRVGIREQKTYPLTMYEYLPDVWKKDLDTLMAAFEGVGTIVKILANGVTNEGRAMYREFMTATGFSELVFKYWCQKLNVNDVIYDLVNGRLPVLMIMPQDICYGALQGIARGIGRGLEAMGEKVIYTSDMEDLTSVLNIVAGAFKMVVGIHAIVLNDDYFRGLTHVPKVQVVMDSTYFVGELFDTTPDPMYTVLCHDENYIDFVKRFYHHKNVKQFFGGYTNGLASMDEARTINLSFVGTYKRPNEDFKNGPEDSRNLYDYLIANPSLNYEEAIRDFCKQKNMAYKEEDIPNLIWEYREPLFAVSDYYRDKIMRTLLGAGISVDVYGDSWNSYEGEGKDKLIIHEATDITSSEKVLRGSKLSLNIMSWHKGGITERVFNVMAAGAVLITDKTSSMERAFCLEEGKEELITFDLDAIDALPDKIKELLADEKRQADIRKRALDRMEAFYGPEHIGARFIDLVLNDLEG